MEALRGGNVKTVHIQQALSQMDPKLVKMIKSPIDPQVLRQLKPVALLHAKLTETRSTHVVVFFCHGEWLSSITVGSVVRRSTHVVVFWCVVSRF
ncbi:hypothetical protein F2Q68_00027209 [Brassica cretica]|uniref:Uncharacterized protein n=1 Tax=Brassica cretica TaxID=69181 RepID=A0A8S9I9T4_BRACR|nr:hypothetical protein F2Q68_00027209 [Brassica cretica]